MAALPPVLLRHTVTVEAYSGAGAFGPTYADPVAVRCLVEHRRRRVRTASGTAAVSSTTVYAPLGTTAPPLSRVTLPDGHTAEVVERVEHDGGGLPTPDHVELRLI